MYETTCQHAHPLSMVPNSLRPEAPSVKALCVSESHDGHDDIDQNNKTCDHQRFFLIQASMNREYKHRRQSSKSNSQKNDNSVTKYLADNLYLLHKPINNEK
jgi:hypothetical protein